MPTTAGWLGWTQAPEQVAGLSYAQIAALDARVGGCQSLYRHYRDNRFLKASQANRWQADCVAQIARARKARHYAEQVDKEVDAAWQAVLAHQEAERQEAQRRRELREGIEQAQKMAESLRDAEEEQEKGRQQRLERLDGANIHGLMGDVPNLPLAFTVGSPSTMTLKRFLACLEVLYPNDGYAIRRDGDKLSVKAERANMLRGDVLLESRYARIWDSWTLQYLSVGEIRAENAQDRYVLAKNLLGAQCPSDRDSQ
ncbi:MAG: hypothetical protein VX793_08380 [Pseudomonadota bacterium]|nr:hypothetical protein [Pseudomonadota bacterium]